MKVYLDQSIITEWLKFQVSAVPLPNYADKKGIKPDFIPNLEAFLKILTIPFLEFFYSPLNDIECSELGENKCLYDELTSRKNFHRVQAPLRACMVSNDLPADNFIETGEVESYFSSNIRKLDRPIKKFKNRADFKKYMRKKYFDPMHIDSAVKSYADFFLTIDDKLIKSIKSHPKFRAQLSSVIKVLTPYELISQIDNI